MLLIFFFYAISFFFGYVHTLYCYICMQSNMVLKQYFAETSSEKYILVETRIEPFTFLIEPDYYWVSSNRFYGGKEL